MLVLYMLMSSHSAWYMLYMYKIQVRELNNFLLIGASIYTDARYGSSSGETTSLLYSFNCTDIADSSKLKDCSLIDNCTKVCDNPTGIQCYGN